MADWIRIGITGADGFIGCNLRDAAAKQSEFIVIPCPESTFADAVQLRNFVVSCDAIVHLAAVSRHSDEQYLYKVNMDLVRKLIAAMEAEEVAPHVLFASTTHEAKDTPYHASKRDGRKLLDDWAARSGGRHTALLMPNTFGPYGKPYYNSVVATFCQQLADGETPQIQADSLLKLIYIRDLCREILGAITGEIAADGGSYSPPHRYEITVAELLARLRQLADGKIPDPALPIDVDLAETFAFYRHNELERRTI